MALEKFPWQFFGAGDLSLRSIVLAEGFRAHLNPGNAEAQAPAGGGRDSHATLSILWLLVGFVAGASEDGKAGIFGKGGIGDGEFAEPEGGAAIGLDASRVNAGGAEADVLFGILILGEEHRTAYPGLF